jgi:hypothetical protein
MTTPQIPIPQGWLQVSQMPFSNEDKSRIYKGIKTGAIPSLKLSGGKFAPVYAPEKMASDLVAGVIQLTPRNEKVEQVLAQITAGACENSRIAQALSVPSGSVSNYVRTLVKEGKVVIERQRYYLAGKEPSKNAEPVHNGPFKMSQDLGGLSLSLTNLEAAIDQNSGHLEAMVEGQKETNRLLSELLNIWKK